MTVYYLDDRLTAPESTGGPRQEERFYVTVIRRSGRPGWVFRFPAGQKNLEYAMRTLDSLNGVTAAAA